MSTRSKRGAGLGRAGFTILELLIAATISAGLIYAIANSTLRASRAYAEGSLRSNLISRAHQVVDRIAAQLEQAGVGTLQPPLLPLATSSTLTFQQVVGYGGGAVVWSADNVFAFQLETGEIADGLDNNGDGRIDEGVVVWTQNVGQPNQSSVVLCHGVSSLLQGEVANLADDNGNGLIDEPGLAFELQGNVLVIRLSLEVPDDDGRLVVKTVQTAVRVRN